MNTLTSAAPSLSIAARKAAANFAANARALAGSQSALDIGAVTDVQWMLGRDGYLSALDASNQWLAGCSVPYRAAQIVLKTLDVRGSVACFLSPCHAAELRAAMEKLRPEQAIIAVVPDQVVLNEILHCDDFSNEIEAHRVYFAAGENWTDAMCQLLVDNSGLAEPQQFIKTNRLAEETVTTLAGAAQECIGQISKTRASQIVELRSRPRRARQSPLKLGLIASSRFRLWSDAGHALVSILGNSSEIDVERLDLDDPAQSSPLALANLGSRCDAVMSADLARADAPSLLPCEQPWITWTTQPRIIAAASAGPHDALILAEPKWRDLAIKQGWSDDRLTIGAWPAPSNEIPLPSKPALALFANATSLDVPDDISAYSSHRLLWESIRRELLADPFAAGDDARGYLASRMKKLDLTPGSINEARFLQELILPARQQGIAQAIVQSDLPVVLHGTGWDRIESLSPFHQSGHVTREEFDKAIGSATALVHVWPSDDLHWIDFTGRPVIRSFGALRQRFLQSCAQALRTPRPYTAPAVPAISVQLIVEALTKYLSPAR